MKIIFCLWVMAWLLAGVINCQSYFFERIIECQNNDFEIIMQKEGNEILSDAIQGSRSIKLDQRNPPQLKQSELRPIQEQHPPRLEGQVRCKKWIQSYKLYKRTNLRSDNARIQQNPENELNNEISNKRKLIAFRHSREILHESSDQLIEEAAGTNKSGNQKVRMALFTLINTMQSITIYQGQ